MKKTIKKLLLMFAYGFMLIFGAIFAVWASWKTIEFTSGDGKLTAQSGEKLTLEKRNEMVSRVRGIFTDSNGNVGIGTSSPAGLIDVSGSNKFYIGTNEINNRMIGSDGSTLYFRPPVDGNFIEIRDGNTDNALKFHVSSLAEIIVDTPVNLNGSLHFKTDPDSGDNGDFAFFGGSASKELLRIKGSGNVGIGTTSPVGKLQVSGVGLSNPIMQDLNDRPSIGITGNYPQLVLFGGGTNNVNHGSTIMLGSYDSGTSGTHKHWSIGTAGNGSSFLDIGYSSADLNAHSGIRNYNGSTFFTILNNGNVGIGDLNPNYKLTVNGQPAANGYTQFTNYSDIRLKKNIISIEDGIIEKIMNLSPVSFKYNNDYFNITGYDEINKEKTYRGFIAQELRNIFPEMVNEKDIGGEKYLDTDLSSLQIYLLKGIQEQQNQIDKLIQSNKELNIIIQNLMKE